MPLLNPGAPFPSITLTPVDAEPLDLPDVLAGQFAVVLFYRGSWCPYCNAQLRAFRARHRETRRARGQARRRFGRQRVQHS